MRIMASKEHKNSILESLKSVSIQKLAKRPGINMWKSVENLSQQWSFKIFIRQFPTFHRVETESGEATFA